MNKQELIVQWNESKYLVISSMFILPTSIISYIRHYYTYSILMALVVFCSMNYWRKATYGKRRTIDLIISKIAFCVYFYNGILNLHGFNLIIGVLGLIGMVYSYYKANYFFTTNNINWLKYHCTFHLFVGIQSFIVVYYLPNIIE